MSTDKMTEEQKAVAIVKAWMSKRGYSTGGGDNIQYLLANLEAQIWDRVDPDGKALTNG